jgi:hypothetical protein
MTDDQEPGSITELASVSRETPPPAHLEDRIVATLRREGLVRGSRRERRVLQIAAALALFLGGLAIGRTTAASAPVAESHGPRFLLLLHGGPTSASPEEEAAVVSEYRDWAVGLRQAGRFVSGERLADVSAITPPASVPGVDGVRGYFLISAANLEDALEMARTCPHARRGGHVVVRPIDPT